MAEKGGRKARRLCCAIYTRKSSDEGLEQEFNSLHAQREACEAFIASQRHEGWHVLSAQYDDGGFSGGTMDRPALKRLLGDIATVKIDVLVVYKIDRLTRSLFDFAKIVEVFDAKGVSFVSVTQQFNTTTSMGRLTLNVLLSFAQFEREVTSSRGCCSRRRAFLLRRRMRSITACVTAITSSARCSRPKLQSKIKLVVRSMEAKASRLKAGAFPRTRLSSLCSSN